MTSQPSSGAARPRTQAASTTGTATGRDRDAGRTGDADDTADARSAAEPTPEPGPEPTTGPGPDLGPGRDADPSRIADRDTTAGDGDPAVPSPAGGPVPPRDPLLGRLNQHGFRLVQVVDLVSLSTIAVGTMYGLNGWDWPGYAAWRYALSFPLVVLTFLASFYFGGLYEREPRLGRPPVLPWAFRQSLGAGGIIALANLLLPNVIEVVWGFDTPRALPIPNTVLVVLILASPLAVALARRASAEVRTRREGPPRVLLLGTRAEITVARDHLERSDAVVVTTVTSDRRLEQEVAESGATNLMLLSAEWAPSLYPDVVDRLERRGVSVLQRVTAAETLYGIPRVRQVGGLPFVLLRAHVMPRSRARLKRVTDLVLLVLGVPLWAPVLALVALYQFVVAGRPLLFWQRRVGAGNSTFRMVKFRTMQVDAEEDGSPRLATREDARIIAACGWVRATRMDELPQVFNILRGEMSLVGPRPERPELTTTFEDEIVGYARRHEVPPGLTGLAQIHGHYHTDPEYKLGYDLQYVANWSPMLDLEILLRTVWVVVSQRI